MDEIMMLFPTCNSTLTRFANPVETLWPGKAVEKWRSRRNVVLAV